MKNIVCIREKITATAIILDALVNPQHENETVIIWQIDSGPYKRHKIFDRFYKTPIGRRRFQAMLDGINYKMDWSDGIDLQRLVKKRAEILIDYTFSETRRGYINIIGAYKITDKMPEFDPFKPVSEEKFYHTYNPKKLPIK